MYGQDGDFVFNHSSEVTTLSYSIIKIVAISVFNDSDSQGFDQCQNNFWLLQLFILQRYNHLFVNQFLEFKIKKFEF